MKRKSYVPKQGLETATLDAKKEQSIHFLVYLNTQRILLGLGLAFALVQFLVLKFCFPLPDFFLDTFTYIQTAVVKAEINYRPMGYPHFLMFLHGISTNAVFTVAVQYSFFVLSNLFCFFSCDYLFGFPKKLKLILYALLLFNPLLAFESNLISSDSLFCSLSVVWFTSCIWVLKRHSWPALAFQVLFLVLCFYIRYSAIFYPIITVFVFILSTGKLNYKIAGIIITLLAVRQVIEHQKDTFERIVHVRTFSGFTGWQIANNVLCYYKDITIDNDDLPSPESKIIDAYVKKFIDSMPVTSQLNTDYFWNKKSPLRLYLNYRLSKVKNTYFNEWCAASQPLNEYAWAIIKKDPMAYLRYYMAPNLTMYLKPEPEVLRNYNFFGTVIEPNTKKWFELKEDNLHCRYPNLQNNIIAVYPMVFVLTNLMNIAVYILLFVVFIKKKKKVKPETLRLMLASSVFFLGYMFFSIFSTVVFLRYLTPIFVLGLILPCLLINQYLEISGINANKDMEPEPIKAKSA